jgi:hypothetical protein
LATITYPNRSVQDSSAYQSDKSTVAANLIIGTHYGFSVACMGKAWIHGFYGESM